MSTTDIWGIAARLLLAAIQGITEIFPVSSSGHLVVLGNILNQGLTFGNVLFLHLGTFAAILIAYRKDVGTIILGKAGWRIPWLMFLSVIATSLLGLFITRFIVQRIIDAPSLVAMMWAINGVTVGIFGHVSRRGTRQLNELKIGEWILLGLVQGITAIPGLSRLGFTLGTALMLNLTWFEALRTSFLLSLPVILAANLYNLAQPLSQSPVLIEEGVLSAIGTLIPAGTGHEWVLFLMFLVTFGSSLLAIRFLSRFLGRRLLIFFGLYCLLAGVFFPIFLGIT